MFTNFFLELRKAHLPVSMKEYLLLLEAVKQGLADYKVDDFYYLSRSALVKDERNLDKFDRVFGHVFKGWKCCPSCSSRPTFRKTGCARWPNST